MSKNENLTPLQAVENLRDMQSQIICGSNTFGDIADSIERLNLELASLKFALGAVDYELEKIEQTKWGHDGHCGSLFNANAAREIIAGICPRMVSFDDDTVQRSKPNTYICWFCKNEQVGTPAYISRAINGNFYYCYKCWQRNPMQNETTSKPPGANHFCAGESGSGEWSNRANIGVCGYCGQPSAMQKEKEMTK